MKQIHEKYAQLKTVNPEKHGGLYSPPPYVFSALERKP